jgi:hypothetical protein
MFVVTEDILRLESSPQSNWMLRASVYHSLALSDNKRRAFMAIVAFVRNMPE